MFRQTLPEMFRRDSIVSRELRVKKSRYLSERYPLENTKKGSD